MQSLQNRLKTPQNKTAIIELAKEIIANYQTGNTLPLKMLMLLATRNQKGSWRAAWVCQTIAELQHTLFLKYDFREQVTLFLPRCTESGHKRILLLLLLQFPLPSEPSVALMNHCIELLSNSKEKVGLQINALKYLYKLAEYMPDLMHELKVILKERETYFDSSGVRSAKNSVFNKINSFQKHYE